MPCATSLYAARKREAIFSVLSTVQGRKCANCQSKEELEFDVIRPVGGAKSHHGKMSWSQRMIFYCRQLAAGNLQLLCTHCNSSKRWNEDQQREAMPEPIPSENPS